MWKEIQVEIDVGTLIDLVFKRLAELITLEHIVGIKVRRETLFFLPISILVKNFRVFQDYAYMTAPGYSRTSRTTAPTGLI